MGEEKSTRGRKKKSETKTNKIQFYIEDSIKEELERQADIVGLELKEYLRWIITQRARNVEVITQVVSSSSLITGNAISNPQSVVVEQTSQVPKKVIEEDEKPRILQNSMFGKK